MRLRGESPDAGALIRPRPICLECMSRVCRHFEAAPPRLMPQEVRIIGLLGGGLSNKELATAAGLTPATVKVYLSRVFPKLGLTSRLEVALWARDHQALITDSACPAQKEGKEKTCRI